jgi:drug/metabolite transporter (DMT)-like permease
MSPFLALVLGIFAVSTSAIFIRLAQREANSIVVAAYRLSFASLILLPFAWQKRAELRGLRCGQVGLILLSGAFLAVHFATWISSLAYTSVASSVVLVTTTPLWVGLLSPLVLHERLSARLWGGLLVALCGGILVGVSEACRLTSGGLACPDLAVFTQGKAYIGNLLALTGAVMAAGYMIVGRRLRPTLSLVSYISSVYGTAAVLLVGMAVLSGQKLSGFSSPTYLWFLCLALFPQLLGHTSYNYGLGYLPAAFVSVATLAEPIGSILLAVLVLGELPSVLEVAGGAIILIGIGLASWKNN